MLFMRWDLVNTKIRVEAQQERKALQRSEISSFKLKCGKNEVAGKPGGHCKVGWRSAFYFSNKIMNH